MIKFAAGCLLAAFIATPVFAAAEKPNGNAGKGYHCRKLAYEKYHVQDGRALNKAIGPPPYNAASNLDHLHSRIWIKFDSERGRTRA